MEKEYIERGAFIENLKRFAPEHFRELTKMLMGKEHAADVVEVVRCKDCKHAKMHIDIIGDPHLFCGLSINRTEMEFDDYCSYGERKEV